MPTQARLFLVVVAIVVVSLAIIRIETLSKNQPVGSGVSVTDETVSPEGTASSTLAPSVSPTVQPTSSVVPTKEQSMNPKQYTTLPPMTIDANKTYIVTMVTSLGSMKIQLFPKETPVTVNSFVFLSRGGFYNGTIFHRILSGFMVQGGDPTGTGRGGPGYQFNDEPVTRDYVRGTIAMANSGPNTNGSQFFIMHANNPLPKQYVIFGAIDPNDSESLKTLDAIASVEVTDPGTGEKSRPVTPPTISSVTIEEK